MKIPFNKPYQSPKALEYIQDAMDRGHLSGNGYYTKKCQRFFEDRYEVTKCLLTTSCSDALEMAAILLDIQPGDEVIMPSFTFVSTANAFVLRGAKIRFVDSHKDHPGMDETKIEELINERSKVIVAVHYAGVACDMDLIMELSKKHGLYVVEDAAQAIESQFQGKQLGTFGHLGTISFHETKNIQCGEGGMLMVNDEQFVIRAETIWNKGTDKASFLRGGISKYQWTDLGSSFQLSEINSAILFSQLEEIDEIVGQRESVWDDYYNSFKECSIESFDPVVKAIASTLTKTGVRIHEKEYRGNSHIFYLNFSTQEERMEIQQFLKSQGIMTVFHYQALHKSPFCESQFPDEFKRELPQAEYYSDCLLRLPMYFQMGSENPINGSKPKTITKVAYD